LLLLPLAAVLTGCVTKPPPEQSPAVQQQAMSFTPPPGMAGIYVVRPSQFTARPFNFEIQLDANKFGLLPRDSYLFGLVPAGDHALGAKVLASGAGTMVTRRFHAEAGKNYFLQTRVMEITELPETEGQIFVKKFKLIGGSAETAASVGQWELSKARVAEGASADAEDKKGLTSLFYAARKADASAVEFLLAHGANVNHVSKAGETPLMWAAVAPGDNLETVGTLVRAGAEVNKRTPKGVTALGFAALAGNAGVALWLYENGADPAIPEEQCEINGRLVQFLGDCFLAQDSVEKARVSFEKAQRDYRATVKAVKAQLAAQQFTELMFDLAQITLAAAAHQQSHVQGGQVARVAALSRAARSGGGVRAYSTYLQKYNRLYVPTYNVGYFRPPDPSGSAQNYLAEKIKYYEQMERFMGTVLECFANYASLAELHGRIENLGGQSRSPYAFAIACLQDQARAYAAKSGNTNLIIDPMELPENLYGKQLQSEIHFGDSVLWRLTIMSGWTTGTQARPGYDLDKPFLRITFLDAGKRQTGEVYFRINQKGDKMTVLYKSTLADPGRDPDAINGEFDLVNYESRIRDDLQRIAEAQLRQMAHP
jgi:hypothetical protein